MRLLGKPAVEPVTLAETKLHLRVDTDAEDALIEGLIRTAREYAEAFLGRALITQTRQYNLDRWPARNEIWLPRVPVQTIEHVRYHDIDGGMHQLTGYEYDDRRIVLDAGNSWPRTRLRALNPIEIEYVAGYPPEPAPDPADPPDQAGNVPEHIKTAIKLAVGIWYENREGVLPAGHVGKELPMGVQSLLWWERNFWTPELNR